MFLRDSSPAGVWRRGRSVSSRTLGLSVTFALACASATFFLFLRCEGKGRLFGRSSRRWALSVIGVTSVVSTVAAFVVVTIVDHLPSAFVGVGVLAPSWLWVGQIRSRRGDERSRMRDMSTLWLTWLLARMHESLAEDRLTWCEERVDPMWNTDELHRAARFYHEYLQDRLSPEERRRGRIHAQLNAIEARLNVAHLVENGAGRTKVTSALQGSRTTKEVRYSRYLDDPSRLADILRHDAHRDLVRLLGSAYNAGYYGMKVYTPPKWATAP
jgi:hypothetical protein